MFCSIAQLQFKAEDSYQPLAAGGLRKTFKFSVLLTSSLSPHWKHTEAMEKLEILPPAWVNANTKRKLGKFLQQELGKAYSEATCTMQKHFAGSQCSPNRFPLLSLRPAIPFNSARTAVSASKVRKAKHKAFILLQRGLP